MSNNKKISFLEKNLFKNRKTFLDLNKKRKSKSSSYLSIKDTQQNLIKSLSKNDEYIIREYSKIKPPDFDSYIETVDNSLNNYLMDYEGKNDEKMIKISTPKHYMNIKDKLLIKAVHKNNHNFLLHALTPRNEDAKFKITIKEKRYPSPYQSLAVIKHNSFIFDEINKDFLNRQGDLFKQKILNIKRYNNKYKAKMPKIHISNFTRIPFEIPLVDLTEDKDKKVLPTFKNLTKKLKKEGNVQLYAYYRYANRNFPEGREQFC